MEIQTVETAPELTERTRNTLMRAGYYSLDEIAVLKPHQLLAIPNFGHRSIKEIEQWARNHGKIAGNERDMLLRQYAAMTERLSVLQRDHAALGKRLGL